MNKKGLLRPPNHGEWAKDPTTGEWLFAFKCKCNPNCPEVYVVRSNEKFDAKHVRTIDNLLTHYVSGVKIMIDAPLTIVAGREYLPELYEDDIDRPSKVSSVVRLINATEFGIRYD